MAKKALVFLAPGAEEMEFVVATDVLRRGGVEVTIAGIPDKSAVKGGHGINILPDISVTDACGPYDALVLPGGLGGTDAMACSEQVGKLLKEQEKEGRLIAAICAAPLALKAHGIGEGKTVTLYPALKPKLEEGGKYKYKEDKVVIDCNFITSQGPATSFLFALAIVEQLYGKDKSKKVAEEMLLTC